MYLVFDIGVTKMRLAVSEDGQTLQASKIVPTAKDDFEQGIQIFKQVVTELSGNKKILGAAGGVASPIDKDKTMIVHEGSGMAGWVDKPFKAELEKMLGCRVVLENDTVVGGIGEAVRGAGSGKDNVGYITIGSGVGGKRIIGGKIDQYSFNFEPGHQVIVPDGYPCHCGGKGHLEAYVGGVYIEEKNHQKAENIKDPDVWDEIAKYLAIGLTNTVVHWTPDILVLGGSVSESIPLEKIRAYLSEFLTIYPQAPEIVKATLGHDAGLYGALEYLR